MQWIQKLCPGFGCEFAAVAAGQQFQILVLLMLLLLLLVADACC